ncbi:spore germination protein PF [Cytobacillus horneckiae]|uniref:Spore germination protein n=1 Tax=Cytobacillus horneckiae TaxID=549687 RepID=A0A2N0ZB93_9BACI|nr:spore germination protein [Cytobacillus horneckiae]NRG44190.1 spore germination protein [Bacillus sp. CRN 9]MBN6887596.1 spore germination protein [Cytobacillus horneckiae]MCM3178655.1 spore germination protein [Cytobacillus horneckiae]MEC1155488.1 spore germination protein [Cytobacillus horneckiae]MED2936807.1 spore germination protein [Cytobacillus horneckiae]
MPAIIGPVQIISVGGGIVQFGDTLYISPKSNAKSNSGAGAVNTGGFIITNNGLSASNVLDTNLVDQPTIGNL